MSYILEVVVKNKDPFTVLHFGTVHIRSITLSKTCTQLGDRVSAGLGFTTESELWSSITNDYRDSTYFSFTFCELRFTLSCTPPLIL